MFFLAAADGEGRPCSSYRRRAAGLHKVVGPASLAFPERSPPEGVNVGYALSPSCRRHSR